MVTLGAVELNGSVQWLERYQASKVAQTEKRTLGGVLVVHHLTLVKGDPITLEATEDTGWFTKDMVDAIIAMANTAGGRFAFEYHGQQFTVMFRNSEPPSVEFTPLIPKAAPAGDDYFIGTVKLFTV